MLNVILVLHQPREREKQKRGHPVALILFSLDSTQFNMFWFRNNVTHPLTSALFLTAESYDDYRCRN